MRRGRAENAVGDERYYGKETDAHGTGCSSASCGDRAWGHITVTNDAVPDGIDLKAVDGLLQTPSGRTVARRGRVWSQETRGANQPAVLCGGCVEVARGVGVGRGAWSARSLAAGEQVTCSRCGQVIR